MMQWFAIILVLPYTILLLIIFRGIRKIKPYKPNNKGTSFISVIIPCRNEEENLKGILQDLKSQNYPEDLFEIILVDDLSYDNTAGTARSFKYELRNLSVIQNSGKGKKAAINTGISIARGSLLVTTDADCRMGPGWLRAISDFHSESGSKLIICPVRMKGDEGIFSGLSETEFLALQGITAGTASMGNAVMCNGANLAFSKELYVNHQRYLHPSIPSGDDIFLLHSAKKDSNYTIRWLESTDALLETASPSSFIKLIKQRKRWLSKAGAYNDLLTIVLGIVTFVTILLQAGTMALLPFNHTFIYIYLAIFFLKSLPDFLIIRITANRYNIKGIMQWFIPLQVIYPFYVLIVAVTAFTGSFRRN